MRGRQFGRLVKGWFSNAAAADLVEPPDVRERRLMCETCAGLRPWNEPCPYIEAEAEAGNSDGDGTAAEMPWFSADQIADQLTDGYWSAFGGARAFDVSTGGTLYVDVSGLTTAGQSMARQALQAWSDVTGIIFAEVDPVLPPLTTWTEEADAASSVTTGYSMAVGDDFRGTLSTGDDRDAVALILGAGDRVSIALSGDDDFGSGLEDPYLRLLDSAGNVIAENDDAQGRDSLLTFAAPSAGTYFIQAGSYSDAYPGDYRLTVREISVAAQITFDDEAAGAYATSSLFGDRIVSSFVNVNANWAGGQDRIDGYYFQSFLHEIGHALGLGHAGNYNGGAAYATDAHYANDSWQASVMSYFYQTENTAVDADFAYVVTPMVADIVAIQSLYGTPETRPGDTVYGRDGNTGGHLDGAFDLSNPVTMTVFDSGGTDVFDFSDQSAHQVVDLREEAVSSVHGIDGNLVIARGTVIEYAMTGTGNDTLTGNDGGNGLSSGAGHDTIRAGAGDDAITGETGDDDLGGGDGRDLIEGGGGADLIDGGAGDDILFGDGIGLGELAAMFPAWSPPPDAAALIESGDILALWEDILLDVFA